WGGPGARGGAGAAAGARWGGGGGVLPGRDQPDARAAGGGGRGRGRRRGGGRGLAARQDARLDPRRRRRALLRDAVELEGVSARPRVDGERRRRCAVALERRRVAADRRRRRLVHLWARPRGRRPAERRERRAPS